MLTWRGLRGQERQEAPRAHQVRSRPSHTAPQAMHSRLNSSTPQFTWPSSSCMQTQSQPPIMTSASGQSALHRVRQVHGPNKSWLT